MKAKDRKTKKASPLPRLLLVLTGLLLIADTFFVLTRSSMTLGVIMPAVMGLPLLLCGLFLPLIRKLRKKSRLVRALCIAMAAVYILFILLFLVTTTLILVRSAPPSEPADVLIVLGCGIRGTRPTLTMRYRLDKAAEYLNENPSVPCIVSGGQSYDEICSEASVMRAYLIGRGIAEDRIIMEEASESTEENFTFSMKIIEERGLGRKVAFVTTRFHVYRSELVAKKLGIDAQGIPAKGVWYITFNDYLRECAALTKYFLSGSI